ncbi:MAG TPA: hypothetical protein VGI35_07535, partial [Steroidobacteraceae bacterium]
PLEVHYRVGGAGCGVRRIELNGKALPFSTEANPHRSGAALVPRPEVRIASGENRLEIELG